jgi:hypothetical protein
MSQRPDRPPGRRQLSGLAASGGFVFYVIIVAGLLVVIGGLLAIRLLG